MLQTTKNVVILDVKLTEVLENVSSFLPKSLLVKLHVFVKIIFVNNKYQPPIQSHTSYF